MKVLYAASEALPFISSGGLSDVAGALPKAISDSDSTIDIRVVLPYYSSIKDEYRKNMKYITNFEVTLSWRKQYCGIFSCEYNGITYYFIDNEYYFKRDGIYGHFDDAERFAFFSKAILDMMQYVDFFPDVLHLNDWQTALCALYQKKIYINDSRYYNIKTVFTIHNIMYQGQYGKDIINDIIGIPEYADNDLMYNGDCNFMKGAICTSDIITTVSNKYLDEIMHGQNSYGLEHALNLRKDCCYGIINGVDEKLYNPRGNELAYPYNGSIEKYKVSNKKALQKELGLPEKDVPVISVVTRITYQKGIDILKEALKDVINCEMQLVVLGTGDYMDEEYFKYLQATYPDKVSANIKFDKEMSKRIYAGSDIFIMPSRTEPCGIAQMIACRYGAIPVVRATGGLDETIKCYDPNNTKGTLGFSFIDYSGHVLRDTIWRAVDLYYNNKEEWNKLRKRCMAHDFSWTASAKKYIEVYNK